MKTNLTKEKKWALIYIVLEITKTKTANTLETMFGGGDDLLTLSVNKTGVVEEKINNEWQHNNGHEVDEETSITNCQTIKGFD